MWDVDGMKIYWLYPQKVIWEQLWMKGNAILETSFFKQWPENIQLFFVQKNVSEFTK